MLKKYLSLILIVLITAPYGLSYTQQIDSSESNLSGEQLENYAREILQETSSMILSLGSPVNRISFTIQSADVLWKVNENDARSLYGSSIEDIKRLMNEIEIQSNQQSYNSASAVSNRNSSSRSQANNFFTLRSNLLNSLAKYDPNWALAVLQETGQLFTNDRLKRRLERDNKRLESLIIKKIAENDPNKAIELGRQKLEKDVNYEVISLLTKIYQKDAAKGAEFGREIVEKLDAMNLENKHTWLVIRLFQNGVKYAETAETPLFENSEMRKLVELITEVITQPKNKYRNMSDSVLSEIEKYDSNSAIRIRQVIEQRNSLRTSRNNRNSQRQKTVSDWEKRRNERRQTQQNLSETLSKLNSEDSGDDEKNQTILEEARRKIMAVNDDEYRFKNLVSLAIRAANLGEQTSAGTILTEAENFTSRNLQEKKDFSNYQKLAEAYALIEPAKSFAIYEDMIYRLNSIIESYVRYMEFSGNRRAVDANELMMNNYGSQFINYLKFSPNSLKSLAASDFARTKDLADKFNRPEVRIKVRLLMANAILRASKMSGVQPPTLEKIIVTPKS